MARNAIRLSLDVSPELNEALEEMSEQASTSKAEVLRRAIALMHMALEAKAEGKTISVSDKKRTVLKEILV